MTRKQLRLVLGNMGKVIFEQQSFWSAQAS
jgi:hypothetical protein